MPTKQSTAKKKAPRVKEKIIKAKTKGKVKKAITPAIKKSRPKVLKVVPSTKSSSKASSSVKTKKEKATNKSQSKETIAAAQVLEDLLPELSTPVQKSEAPNNKKGIAPKVPKSQYYGKMRKYNLHHMEPIYKGGDVYNLDNIVITTPKYHKQILHNQKLRHTQQFKNK